MALLPIGGLASSPVIVRHPANPILTSGDVPYPSTLVLNPGVTKYEGQYVMAFRNDYGREGDTHFDGTNIGLAWSDDGVHWDVAPEPWIELRDDEIRRAYDPRLTVIEGRCYMCFAVDTRHGVRGGIAVTDDVERFEILSMSAPDNRNMVLFNERLGGDLPGHSRRRGPGPVMYVAGHAASPRPSECTGKRAQVQAGNITGRGRDRASGAGNWSTERQLEHERTGHEGAVCRLAPDQRGGMSWDLGGLW